MDIPAVQCSQYQTVSQPNYNAVKIDIIKPQVNVAGPQVKSEEAQIVPVYNSIPTASIYEVPVN